MTEQNELRVEVIKRLRTAVISEPSKLTPSLVDRLADEIHALYADKIDAVRKEERERIAHDIGGAISLLFVTKYSACMKRLVEIRQALKGGSE